MLIVGFWFPGAVFLKMMNKKKEKKRKKYAMHCYYDNKLIDTVYNLTPHTPMNTQTHAYTRTDKNRSSKSFPTEAVWAYIKLGWETQLLISTLAKRAPPLLSLDPNQIPNLFMSLC